MYVKNGSTQPSHRYNTPHFAHWWLQACCIAILFNGTLQSWNCYGVRINIFSSHGSMTDGRAWTLYKYLLADIFLLTDKTPFHCCSNLLNQSKSINNLATIDSKQSALFSTTLSLLWWWIQTKIIGSAWPLDDGTWWPLNCNIISCLWTVDLRPIRYHSNVSKEIVCTLFCDPEIKQCR